MENAHEMNKPQNTKLILDFFESLETIGFKFES